MLKLYNGCPNDELQAIWDSRDRARAELRKVDSNAWCTYFPLEGMYSCSRWDEDGKFEELTEFHSSVEDACAAAIGYLNDNS